MSTSAGATPLTKIDRNSDRKVSSRLKSAEEIFPCQNVTSKWQWACEESDGTLSKCQNRSAITPWRVESKSGTMMRGCLEGIELRDDGAMARPSESEDGSWSAKRGRWREEDATNRCLSSREWGMNIGHQTNQILIGKKGRRSARCERKD